MESSTTPRRSEHELVIPLSTTPELSALLDAIPSETFPTERRFLYKFFSSVWSGRGDVIEIGPFLGGTTRAIALGMQDNPNIEPASALITLDKFKDYGAIDQLRNLLAPLIESGAIPDPVDHGDTSFLSIYHDIHSPHPYFDRLRIIAYKLPDTRAELEASGMPEMPPAREVSAVFIDGCKSWFGTKIFMQEMSGRTSPGACYIFQDYAWYTCFWLPAFLGLFPDKFELWAHVNTTYAFRLREPITREEIEARFPDTPEELGEDALRAAIQNRIADARRENDGFGEIRAEMQFAAGLAYIGKRKRARARLLKIAESPLAAGHEDVIAAALKHPTYRPDRPVTLPQD